MRNLTIKIDFDEFPPEHTCDGEDISPRIRVLGSKAPYLAVIMDDIDAPRGTFTHWLAWNIPSTDEIPEGLPQGPRLSRPVSVVQGMNDFRRTGYGGPCPPKGAPHRFIFRVYGVERELDLPPGVDRTRLVGALATAATEYGEAMAIYERKTVSGIRPPAGRRV